MKTNMTHHAQIDRYDRISYIIDTIGIGNPIAITNDKDSKDCISILTDTGVIMIRNIVKNKLVTMYIATPEQASAVYKKDKKVSRMPDGLYNRILKNQKIAKNFAKTH